MGTNLGGFDTPDNDPRSCSTLRECQKTAEVAVIALNNVRLFNGHADYFCPDATVVYQDGAVVYAGPSEGCPDLDGETQIIDGHSHFVMPGMVESHAHLSYTNNGPLDSTSHLSKRSSSKRFKTPGSCWGQVYLRHQFWLGASRRRFLKRGSSAATCSDRDCWLEDGILGQRAVTLTSTPITPTEN